jgi:hypothetical protein
MGSVEDIRIFRKKLTLRRRNRAESLIKAAKPPGKREPSGLVSPPAEDLKTRMKKTKTRKEPLGD